MEQGLEEHGLEEYDCLNIALKPTQFPSLWNCFILKKIKERERKI